MTDHFRNRVAGLVAIVVIERRKTTHINHHQDKCQPRLDGPLKTARSAPGFLVPDQCSHRDKFEALRGQAG